MEKSAKNNSQARKSASSRSGRKPLKSFRKVVRKIRLRNLRKSLSDIKIGLSSSGVQPSSPGSIGYVAHQPGPRFELPSQYGEDKAVLLVRDPWWVFCYWEVTPRTYNQVTDLMRKSGLAADKQVLRVYDVTGTSVNRPNCFFDIEVGSYANNWYIDVGKPDTDWMIEIGFRAANGRFFALVRSNMVRTPRFGISDVIDEEWMLPDDLYWQLFARSAGAGMAKSSMDVREVLERYLKNIVSSQGASAPKNPLALKP